MSETNVEVVDDPGGSSTLFHAMNNTPAMVKVILAAPLRAGINIFQPRHFTISNA
jgi:hypothetical protein